MAKLFPGFVPLYKTASRLNARQTAPWIAIITLLCLTSFLAYAWIFPTLTDRQGLAATIGINPAFSLIFGPGHNLLTADGFNAWRSLALGSFFAGLMAIFIVVRETRAKEDSGEAEMVGSSVVGRYTQLAVGVGLAWASSVVLGIVTALSMIAVGGNLTSSLLLAAAFTASGMVFAGVAAITCQLGAYAGTASSMATTFLGACFLIRGYADTSPDTGWALWLTPLGWLQKIEPAGANRTWPVLMAVGLALVLVVIAGRLTSARDFARGMLPTRPGARRAKYVDNVFGLALRLQKSPIATWTIAFMLLGTVFGFLISALGTVFSQNAQIAKLLAAGGAQADPVFEFISTILKILGIIAAVYGVGVMMRLYKEEMEVRVDPILAGAVRRPKLYLSHVLIALIGPALALIISGSMMALVAHFKGVDINSWQIIEQAVIEIPAVWVLIGLSIAMIGARPPVRLGAWLAIVMAFVLTIFGPMFKLWDWVQGISPLWHVPNVAAVAPDWIGLLWLGLVLIFLLVAGFSGFARRDIAIV